MFYLKYILGLLGGDVKQVVDYVGLEGRIQEWISNIDLLVVSI